MFQIRSKEFLAPTIAKFAIDAPYIALKRKPGNFVIVRVVEIDEQQRTSREGIFVRDGDSRHARWKDGGGSDSPVLVGTETPNKRGESDGGRVELIAELQQ